MADLIADPFRAARLVLHLRQEGVTDTGVLEAMETIDRTAFTDDPALARLAFEDCLLPIPCGQVILRPAVTGHLLQALSLDAKREARVLVVGFGSGYSSALAAQLSASVHAVERFRSLAEAGRARCERLTLGNIQIRHEDGFFGWPEQGPFDRILLTGSVTEVPEMLVDQLARDGLLVAPVTDGKTMSILRLRSDGLRERRPLFDALPPLVEGRAKVL